MSFPTEQGVPFNRLKVGDIVVTVLVDGYLDLEFGMLTNIGAADAKAMLAAAGRSDAPRVTVVTFLVQVGARNFLIDAGDGTSASTGKLPVSLAAAGVDAAAIDQVLLTHAHPDHIGLLATAAGTARLSNAELLVHEAEVAFWNDDSAMAAAPDPAKPFFIAARAAFGAYKDRTRTFTSGQLAPGITAIPLPGHTPGHTGYMIESNGERLFIWGDIAHFPDIQVARPDVGTVIDVDPEQAVRTRRDTLARVADERLLILGPHIPFPGTVRIVRRGEAFALVPTPWLPAL